MYANGIDGFKLQQPGAVCSCCMHTQCILLVQTPSITTRGKGYNWKRHARAVQQLCLSKQTHWQDT
jgi:hypothetical protein